MYGMEALRLLLSQNQSCLAKKQARILYCQRSVKLVSSDPDRQHGVYAGYWDEWLRLIEDIHLDLKEDVDLTSPFIHELNDYIKTTLAKKRLSKDDQRYIFEVTSLASDKLVEQLSSLKEIDEQINLHRQMTNKLVLVEALEELNDETDI